MIWCEQGCPYDPSGQQFERNSKEAEELLLKAYTHPNEDGARKALEVLLSYYKEYYSPKRK